MLSVKVTKSALPPNSKIENVFETLFVYQHLQTSDRVSYLPPMFWAADGGLSWNLGKYKTRFKYCTILEGQNRSNTIMSISFAMKFGFSKIIDVDVILSFTLIHNQSCKNLYCIAIYCNKIQLIYLFSWSKNTKYLLK